MMSGYSRKVLIVTILTFVFILFAGRTASGITTPPQVSPRAAAAPTLPEAQARLSEGFNQILEFFAQRDFSLLEAWREMRASGDPKFLEHRYPVISKELDAWSASLSSVD